MAAQQPSIRRLLHIPATASAASVSALEHRLIDPLWRVVRELRGPQLLEMRGHEDVVHSVAYSCSGSHIASGSMDKTIRVWCAHSGRCEHTLHGHTDWVTSVAFHPSNPALLASASFDGTTRLWNAASAECMRTLEGHSDAVYSVVFDPIGGARLFSGSRDCSINVWDTESGQLLHTLLGVGGNVSSLAIDASSSSGTLLASGSWDRTIRLWDVRQPSMQCIRTLEGHNDTVRSVSFQPPAARLASSSWDNTVRIWDVGDGRCTHTLRNHTDYVSSVCFDPSGLRLASGSDDGTIRIWDASDFECVQILRGHTVGPIISTVYDPSGSGRLASSGWTCKTVCIWDTAFPF